LATSEHESGGDKPNGALYGDSGSAARFFYTAKADAEDRLGSKHPTVKPLDLMQYLCRLVTPPGGTLSSIRLPAPAPQARPHGAKASTPS
jgi:hypothetical protein